MRALWLAAPVALTRYAAVFAAVVVAVALAAASAASTPFVRAGVKSASLRGQVRSMSPLAAGLEVRSGGLPTGDHARRSGAVQFARSLSFGTQPVLTSRAFAQVAGAEGNNLTVAVMARTNAAAHVTRLSGRGLGGVWVSSAIAQSLGLRPGSLLRLTEFAGPFERPPLVALRVTGVYRGLDGDLGNPYWANFTQDIRPDDPDGPLPPTFVLVPEATFVRLAQTLRQAVENVFEFPVDSSRVTYVGAERLRDRYARLVPKLSTVGHSMGCGRCPTSSSLSSALIIAAAAVGAVSATISLLSICALLISVLVAAAAGVFLVRRRRDEAELLFARGEAATVFGARIAVEALLPTVVGAAGGFGVALLTLRLFAPTGTIDHGTVRAGALHALAAGAVALAAVAVAAACAFPRRADRSHRELRRLARLPWEAAPLAAAGVLLGLLASGAGLAADADGHTHPSISVFLVPVLAAAGIAGLAARAARRALRDRGDNVPVPVFLALRRLAAARGLLVAVVVSAATAVAVFAYAATLSASLARTASEKAFVSNGSDVQGLIDANERILSPLPFPATVVQVDTSDVFTAAGATVDLVACDPAQLRRVMRWGDWPDDPRRLLPRLDRAAAAGVLPVIASPNMPRVDAIVDQGVRVPVRVVARAPFPGMSAGRAAVLVSARTLHAVAAQRRVVDPGPGAEGLVWARGNPRVIEPILARSTLKPAFMTTIDHVRDDASVVAGERSYRYLKAIGAAAVVLALLALLLYLQARQRGQMIASALVRRMGLGAGADGAALALEAAAIAAAASIVGTAVAAVTARLVVPHVDPLPQYAPGTALVFPWLTFLLAGATVTVVAAAFAAAAVWTAGRSDVAEALRVA
jgi:hypothetical protein